MNENIFEQVTSNNCAYWLGFLAADGNISENKNQISIGLASKDRGHLVKFLAFIESNSSITDTTSHCSNNNKYYYSSHINIYSEKIKTDLSKYGIIPNKSKQNINFLEKIPEQFKSSFIIGYFDGDGWFTNTEKTKNFGFCGNNTIITSIEEYFNQKFNWDITIQQYTKSKITYYIQSSNKIKLFDFINLYLSFQNDCDLLERKKEIANIIFIYLNKYKQNKIIKNIIKNNIKICPYCKKEYYSTNLDQKYCSYECSAKGQQKTERPDREQLKFLIRTKSFLQIGKEYGVSDNAIRKWCDKYNLPRKATEIKKYTEEEWEQI